MNYKAEDSRYENVSYVRCGKSGLKLPPISLGLWHNFGGQDILENSRQMLLTAFDLGITHFDLANNYGPPYGSAEKTFGKILSDKGLIALERLMGMLLTAMAIQMFLSGIENYFRIH